MKWYRFNDQNGKICHGRDLSTDNTIQLLEGDPYNGLRDGNQRVLVQKLLAPVEPRAILCIGLNYRQHVGEFGGEVPQHPVLFMKNPAAITHPGDPILLPASCMEPPQVDYETELAVVLGRTAKNVTAAKALDFVLGYTIGNDISARRWQKEGGGGQWVRGKSFDTFCPLGPALVTPDEHHGPASAPPHLHHQRPKGAGRHHRQNDLSGGRADRPPLRRHYPAAGHGNHDRHPERRRLCPHPAALSHPRRHRSHDHRTDRHSHQPGGRRLKASREIPASLSAMGPVRLFDQQDTPSHLTLVPKNADNCRSSC